ncbi:hypothetical protein [Streptomyces justiciae]|uniref:hypothetical protein n=1 Tax=Streptomyces justiciae TaxID=2780140 RepID=UPI002ADE0B73|nr:hypothetical protein [Streptomyces justiciae]
MRGKDGDGGSEVLGRVVDLAGQEGELPAEGFESGTDLPALHGVEGVRELGGRVEELCQLDHGTGGVAHVRGAEQSFGDLA